MPDFLGKYNCEALLGKRESDSSELELYASAYHDRYIVPGIAVTGKDYSLAVSEHFVIFFVGQLLNDADLRKRYELSEQASEAEIILHLCGDLPLPMAINFLNGPFAGCIIDRMNGELVLFRDHLGRRFLFWGLDQENNCWFSTRLDDLAKINSLDTSPDLLALGDYFSVGYIAAPRTIYKGISKISSAHFLRIKQDSTIVHRQYWDIVQGNRYKGSFNDAVHTSYDLLNKAVHRCIAKCPKMGFLLSGGIDSGLMMGLVRQSDQLCGPAVSIAFEESNYDESHLAALVAAIHEVSQVIKLTSSKDLDKLRAMISIAGEPFADSSLLPSCIALNEVAQGGYSMALTGNGGDEIFGGYRRYQAMKYRHLGYGIPGWIAHILSKGIMKFLPSPSEFRSRYGNIYRAINSLSLPSLEAFASFQELFSLSERNSILNCDIRQMYIDDWKQSLKTIDFGSKLERYNILDFMYYMPEDCNRKMDIACHFANIGEFAPIMDMDVVNFAMKLPVDYRYNCRNAKLILRKISADYLPDEVLNQKKRGFGLPIASWFRNESISQLSHMIDTMSEWDKDGWLNHKEVRRLLRQHIGFNINHAPQLWAVYCLYLWKTR